MHKYIWKFAYWLIKRSPDCIACRGTGWKITSEKLDNITWKDKDAECEVCDGYGYNLNWFTKFVCYLVKE